MPNGLPKMARGSQVVVRTKLSWSGGATSAHRLPIFPSSRNPRNDSMALATGALFIPRKFTSHNSCNECVPRFMSHQVPEIGDPFQHKLLWKFPTSNPRDSSQRSTSSCQRFETFTRITPSRGRLTKVTNAAGARNPDDRSSGRTPEHNREPAFCRRGSRSPSA